MRRVSRHSGIESLGHIERMNRNWTPKSHVSITDAGVVIEVELGSIRTASLLIIPEGSQILIRGHHELLGAFESRLDAPAGHSPGNARARFESGILRIDWPPDIDSSGAAPLFGNS